MASDPLTRLDLAAVAAGQRAATADFVRALLPRVRNLVRYLLSGDQDVDDVAQEALVAVLRGFGSYRGTGRLEAWVDRVVVRETFGWLRRRRSETRRIAPEVDVTVTEDPRRLTDEYLQRRQVAGLLDALPADQRHVLVLHYVLGMSVPEISQAVEAPVETVRSRLRLGRARLRGVGATAFDQEAG